MVEKNEEPNIQGSRLTLGMLATYVICMMIRGEWGHNINACGQLY